MHFSSIAMVEVEKVQKIGVVLNDPKRPLKERFRALFTLRNIGGKVDAGNNHHVVKIFEQHQQII